MQFSLVLVNLNRYLTNLFAYCKVQWSWNHFYAAGFPDFRSSLHAKHPGKISNWLLTAYHQFLVFRWISEYLSKEPYFVLFVYLQIRERLKRKRNMVFSSSIENNSTRKSSQVNPSEVGDVWAVELQSCAEFE